MKMIKLFTLITVLMFISISSIQLNAADSKIEFTDLKGDYLGQPLPGDSAVIFAPGIISVNSSLNETCPSITLDGKYLFFSRYNEEGETYKLLKEEL